MGRTKLTWLGLFLFIPEASHAQDWAARFPPDPRCEIPLRMEGKPAETSSFRVILITFSDAAVMYGGRARLVRTGGTDSLPSITVADSLLTFDALEPGRYALVTNALAYHTREDTVTIEAGRSYVVRVPMEPMPLGPQNPYNCRPRGFRRSGQKACVTNGDWVEHALQYAVDLSRPERGLGFGLPRTDPTKVKLVTDESICETAGKRYGKPSDPPRRVIVVRMDIIYMVYDPFEPESAGEFTTWSFFDQKWHWIASIIG